ncbi:MAG: metallophosphoesterase [Bacteroidales bacterium]|jgi:serine/threonine protein phosphatase 1
MRTWVIPDVHGCANTLKSLIENLLQPNSDDTIYFLGDLIDRGDKSKEVIDYIQSLKYGGITTQVIKGNHEYYLIETYKAESNKSFLKKKLNIRSYIYKEWLRHGGKSTLESFGVSSPSQLPEKYVNYLDELPYYIEIDDYYIVHAGFNFANEDIFSDKHSMMWIRDYEIDKDKLNGKKIIHGHVPVPLDFIHQNLNNNMYDFIDIDNGVYMKDRPNYGNLLALEVNTLKLHIQPNID